MSKCEAFRIVSLEQLSQTPTLAPKTQPQRTSAVPIYPVPQAGAQGGAAAAPGVAARGLSLVRFQCCSVLAWVAWLHVVSERIYPCRPASSSQDNQRVTTLKEDKYKQANKTALQTKGNTVEKWSDTQKKDRTKLRA